MFTKARKQKPVVPQTELVITPWYRTVYIKTENSPDTREKFNYESHFPMPIYARI